MKRLSAVAVMMALGLAAPSARAGQISEAIRKAVENPARPEADRARDPHRKPAEILSFFGVAPGMKVAECMAGAGYYAELLSSVVAPEGHVWAQNNRFVLDRYAEAPMKALIERLPIANVTRLDTEIDAPGLPSGLDVVLLIRFYHDFFWMGADRAAFNRAVFEALKPGGVYGVIDHHAEAGSGDRDAKEPTGLHRVDAELVKKEILAAGFVLDAESDLLRHPEDTRDWFIFVDGGKKRDMTDRFVYRFRKPEESKP